MQVFKLVARYFALIGVAFLLLLASCERRSQCPTYADSDPKNLFGEGKTFEQSLKDNKKWSDNKKKDRKVKGLGKKPKREKKRKVSRKAKRR